MPKFTPQQRAYIKKRAKYHEPGPDEVDAELNIVPFLDIVVNLVMFLLMMTSSIAFYSQILASLPSYSRGGVGRRASDEESLNLNITVVENGVIVAASNGKLAPGCEETATGRVVTVPKDSSGYDWAGLTNCVQRIKSHYEEERQVTVSADPTVEYQYLVAAMDAVRETDDQEELFPDVLLSAGVR